MKINILNLFILMIIALTFCGCSKKKSANMLNTLKSMNLEEVYKISKVENVDRKELSKIILPELEKGCAMIDKNLDPVFLENYKKEGVSYTEIALVHQLFIYQDNSKNKEVKKHLGSFAMQLEKNLNEDLKNVCK